MSHTSIVMGYTGLINSIPRYFLVPLAGEDSKCHGMVTEFRRWPWLSRTPRQPRHCCQEPGASWENLGENLLDFSLKWDWKFFGKIYIYIFVWGIDLFSLFHFGIGIFKPKVSGFD